MAMQLTTLNWMNEYAKDMENGMGFRITNPVAIDPKTKKKTVDGLFSPNFGGEDVENISELYSCECKALKGKFYEGITCDECGTEVEYHNNDIEKTGWIVLEDYYLINPVFYNHLIKVMGQKKLLSTIRYNRDIDKDGNIVINMDEIDEDNPYSNIGLVEFREKFDEIMNYYKGIIKPEKMDNLNFIIENKENVFSKAVPVFSLILRPVMIIKDSVVYADINRKYALLLANVDSLNRNDTLIDTRMIKVLPCLYETQMILNEIHNMIISSISKKKGHIRNNLLGSRVNFSSRCVIVPLVGRYRTDEIIVPYLCFLELFKFEIINLISKIDKITISEANNKWLSATRHFDKRVYLIMKHMIKNSKGGLSAILNRNPTISYGSMLSVRIVEVKEDYDDLTMSISTGTLALLAGDFDGDVLNLISIKDRKIAESLDQIFNPRHMMISRNNGKFNRKMSLIKDETIGLHAFCRVDEDNN